MTLSPTLRLVLAPLITIGVLAGSFWLGMKVERAIPLPAARVAQMDGSVEGLTVRTVDGRVLPLADSAGPVVVMVSSESCGYCAVSMRDLAAMSDGGPLPRLRVVSLEGAAGGARMAAEHGLHDVLVVGPGDNTTRTMFTFQFPGTPTFLLVEPDGRVRAAMPGYPGREGLTPWYRVMSGARTAL
jgi:hypothetical protein